MVARFKDWMKKEDLHIIQVGNVLVSPDIFTEKFCCDLDKCHGICCVEGDAGAPISMDEIAETEAVLDVVWPELQASAQAVIDKQVLWEERTVSLPMTMKVVVFVHSKRPIVGGKRSLKSLFLVRFIPSEPKHLRAGW